MEVEYRGESGQDGGGLTNEWFSLVGLAVGEVLELELLTKACDAVEAQQRQQTAGGGDGYYSGSDSGTDYADDDDRDRDEVGSYISGEDEDDEDDEEDGYDDEDDGDDDDDAVRAGGGGGRGSSNARRDHAHGLVTITGGRSTGASCPVLIGDLFEMRDAHGAWGAVRVLAKLDARRVLVMVSTHAPQQRSSVQRILLVCSCDRSETYDDCCCMVYCV